MQYSHQLNCYSPKYICSCIISEVINRRSTDISKVINWRSTDISKRPKLHLVLASVLDYLSRRDNIFIAILVVFFDFGRNKLNLFLRMKEFHIKFFLPICSLLLEESNEFIFIEKLPIDIWRKFVVNYGLKKKNYFYIHLFI